jgi:hypothetical protein
MSGLQPSGFGEFDRLALLFHNARSLLDTLLATGDLPMGGSDVLATETLPHIEDVEQGFRASLRAAEAGLAELQHLVRQTGMVLPEPRGSAEERAALIEAMQALSGAGGERELVAVPARRMTALQHARLVLALMPRTAPTDVHYPREPRTYADIAAPRGPTEFAERVEEIERTLWWVAAGERPRHRDTAYRRVYGFFDVGESLTARGMRLP